LKEREMKTRFLSFCCTPKGVLTLGIVALAAFFVLRNYSDQMAGWLPYLIFLLCPLMHLFMHRSHGRHGGDSGKD
jgi:hypothetical protein